MPHISVLMGVYNGASFLRDSLRSILAQTYSDFEIIIVNDASTDDTPDILSEYTDPRIIVFHNDSNRKLSFCLNKALLHASGEYVARADADDISVPDRFEKQLNYLSQNPEIGVVGTQVRDLSASGKWSRPGSRVPTEPTLVAWNVFLGYPIAHPTAMLRRSVMEEIGGYDMYYPYAQDQALWSQLVFDTRISNLDEELVLYRQHHSSSLYGVKNKIRYELQARSAAFSRLTEQDVMPEEIYRLYWERIRSESYTKEDFAHCTFLLYSLYAAMLARNILQLNGLESVQKDLANRLYAMAQSNGSDVLNHQIDRILIRRLKHTIHQFRMKRLRSS